MASTGRRDSGTGVAGRSPTVSNVFLTLPIACQICLGKVKDPVVCPNQHVFCSTCMAQWLKSNQICPTCRVPVNDKQPCKRLIGSLDSAPTSPDRVMKAEMRKTRFELLYQEYENEIKTTERMMEDLKAENYHIKEINTELKKQLEESEARFIKAIKTQSVPDKTNGDGMTQDINTILKLSSKLQEMLNANEKLKDEIDQLRKDLTATKLEKEVLIGEIHKIKEENSFSRSPQKYGRYTVAALNTKVETYEREIQKLRRALTRSDEYIEQLTLELNRNKGSAPPNSFSNGHSVQNGTNGSSSTESHNQNGERSSRSPLQQNGVRSRHSSTSSSASVPGSGFNRNLSGGTPPSRETLLEQLQVADSAAAQAEGRRSNGTSPRSSGSPNEPPTLTRIGEKSGLPKVFPGSAVSLARNCSSEQNTADLPASGGSSHQTNGEPSDNSSFADPVRFPACAKLIELTKAHRAPQGANNTNSGDNVPQKSPVGDTNGSPQEPIRRSNLLDLLLQPRQDRRQDHPSPILMGQEGSAFSAPNSQQAATRNLQNNSPNTAPNAAMNRSPASNTSKTPSPPALIRTSSIPSPAAVPTLAFSSPHSLPTTWSNTNTSYPSDIQRVPRNDGVDIKRESIVSPEGLQRLSFSGVRGINSDGNFDVPAKRIKREPEE